MGIFRPQGNQMVKQIELIGNHPGDDDPMGRWLASDDKPITKTKCHRELTEKVNDEELIEWMAQKLVEHHYTDFQLERLKKRYEELGFKKYAEQNRKLPATDRVKKGNGTEVLLVEYIQCSIGRKLTHAFKLRYNPNVDQSMKGDDTLLVDLNTDGDNEKLRIFLGESKFRKTPDKVALNDIENSLAKDKVPLSFTFLIEMVSKDNQELASKLDDYVVQDVKDKGDLIYTGFLLSNNKTSKFVEDNLEIDNPHFIMISVGLENPEKFIVEAFIEANAKIMGPAGK